MNVLFDKLMDFVDDHAWILITLVILGDLVCYGAIVYLIAHFVSKYW